MRKNKLSKKYNVDARTIDYWSGVVNILPYTKNTGSNNYREYDENSERVLKKILILREFGYSIEQIRQKLDDPLAFSPEICELYIEQLEKRLKEEVLRIDSLISYTNDLKNERILTKEEKQEVYSKLISGIDGVRDLLKDRDKYGMTEADLFLDLKEVLSKYIGPNK